VERADNALVFFYMSNIVHFLGHVCLQVGYSAPTQSGIVDEVGLSISEVRDTPPSFSENKLSFQCTQSFFASKRLVTKICHDIV
jgi:hypothetical protein